MSVTITHLAQFAAAQFSFVVCLGGALSHVLEQGLQALRELLRVAQPGAVLIIGCDSKYGLMRHYFRYDDDLLEEVVRMDATGEFLDGGAVKGIGSHLLCVAKKA